MIVDDDDIAISWLKNVGYYRLSAYWLPLEEPPADGQTRSKRFKEYSRFSTVIELYIFDRKLRLLVLEALERIEVHLRSRWTYRMSLQYGSHAHLNTSAFKSNTYTILVKKLETSVNRSPETFIKHYQSKYSDPQTPPLWMISELLTFGELSKWFAATNDKKLQTAIAKELGLPNAQIATRTIAYLSYLRNICAHHGRLWNRRTTKTLPKIKKLGNSLRLVDTEQGSENDKRVFNGLVIMLYILDQQSTDSSFRARLIDLLSARSESELRQMGFPEHWKSDRIWK